MKLSFIIPHYGQAGTLLNCLKSLRQYHKEAQVIVVDDATGDECIPDLCVKYGAEYIANEKNSGFAVTCNKGLARADGDILILTNNDIVFTQSIEAPIVDDVEWGADIIGGLLFYPDGRIQHAGVWAYNMNVGHYAHGAHPFQAPIAAFRRYVFSVTGALYAITRKAYEMLGPLDEEYKNCSEDTEYSVRAWMAHLKVCYDPRIQAIHAEGETRGRTPEEKKRAGTWEDDNRAVGRLLKMLKERDYTNLVAWINMNNVHLFRDVRDRAYRRMEALGDCIKITGHLERFKMMNPKSKVYVITKYADVFRGNPNVDGIFTKESECPTPLIYDLDNAYEMRPELSIEDAYDLVATEGHNRPMMYSNAVDAMCARYKAPFGPGDYVVINASRSWRSRDWGVENWKELVVRIKKDGVRVVAIGTGRDHAIVGAVDLRDKLSLQENREVIKGAKCFIGMDSGPFHVAETTETPVVGLFTCALPATRCAERGGASTVAVIAPVYCAGCINEKARQSETIPKCPREYECTKAITVEMVYDAYMEAVK